MEKNNNDPKVTEEVRQKINSVVNRQKVKELTKGYRVSSAYMNKLERRIKEVISDSLTRAVGNRRTTLLARDL